jgi:hypothetical protein
LLEFGIFLGPNPIGKFLGSIKSRLSQFCHATAISNRLIVTQIAVCSEMVADEQGAGRGTFDFVPCLAIAANIPRSKKSNC